MSVVTMRSNIGWWMTDTAPADPNAPTVAEIAAATSILGVPDGEALVDYPGWNSSISDIDAPDVLTLQTPTIPGPESLGTGSLEYKMDTDSNPISDEFTRGAKKWLIAAPLSRAGAAGDECSVWQASSNPAHRMIEFSKSQQFDNAVIAA